jgi:S-adenosylmethionine hydrolase
VILDIAPAVRILDITHDVPAFDVRAGALALVRAVQYLPDGVVLAVVDPGVGTDRRCLAVEVEGGFLVGPDNGLLAPAVAMLGGPTRVVSLENAEYQLPAPGPTLRRRVVFLHPQVDLLRYRFSTNRFLFPTAHHLFCLPSPSLT